MEITFWTVLGQLDRSKTIHLINQLSETKLRVESSINKSITARFNIFRLYGVYRKFPHNVANDLRIKIVVVLSAITKLSTSPMVYVTGFFHLALRKKSNLIFYLISISMKNPESNVVIKVAIADDHTIFRAGVKTSLSARKDIQMVAEAENGMQLLNLLKHIQPDVVLLDIHMPVLDGYATLPEIKRLYPQIKVVMLSMNNDHSIISRMMEIGANSYLTKEAGAEGIYEAIRGVYENEFYFNDLTNKALLSGLRTKTNAPPAMADVHLSEKEITILKLMCEEKSTKEIADMVDLSPRTIEAIRDKLKTKTGTKSMAGLVMYAVKAGIVEQPHA